jgi:raffinose/stachyose/melibiose transport system permease protein
MIMVDVAFSMPFAILIFRAFMSTIPKELDEAAIIDGASPLRVFFSIILTAIATGNCDGSCYLICDYLQ